MSVWPQKCAYLRPSRNVSFPDLPSSTFPSFQLVMSARWTTHSQDSPKSLRRAPRRNTSNLRPPLALAHSHRNPQGAPGPPLRRRSYALLLHSWRKWQTMLLLLLQTLYALLQALLLQP